MTERLLPGGRKAALRRPSKDRTHFTSSSHVGGPPRGYHSTRFTLSSLGRVSRQLPSSGQVRALVLVGDEQVAIFTEGGGRLLEVSTGEVVVETLQGFDWVVCAAVSQGGATIAVGGERGELAFLDALTLETLHESEPSREACAAIACLSFEPRTGATVAAAGGGGDARTVAVIKVTGEIMMEAKRESSFNEVVTAVAYGPGFIVTGDDSGCLSFIDPKNGSALFEVQTSIPIRALCFRPDFLVIAAGGDDGSVTLTDCATGEPVAGFHPTLAHHVLTLAFSPEGVTLAVGSPGQVALLDTLTGETLLELPRPGDVRTLAFTRDDSSSTTKTSAAAANSMLLVGSGDTVAVVEAYPAELAYELLSRNTKVNPYSFASFLGESSIVAAGGPGKPAVIAVEAASCSTQRVICAEAWRCMANAGSLIVAARANETNIVRLYEEQKPASPKATSVREVASLELEFELISLAMSTDGSTVAVGCSDGRLTLLDVTADKLVLQKRLRTTKNDLERISSPVYSVALTDNLTLAAGLEEGEVHLLDATTGETIYRLKAAGGPVHALAFSRDGSTLAAGGQDRKVSLYACVLPDKQDDEDEEEVLILRCECPLPGSCRSLSMWPLGTELTIGRRRHVLAVACGNGSVFILELREAEVQVVSREKVDTSDSEEDEEDALGGAKKKKLRRGFCCPPVDLLLKLKDAEALAATTAFPKAGLRRGHRGLSLCSLAASKHRIGLLGGLLERELSMAFVPSSIRQSNGIVTTLVGRNRRKLLHAILLDDSSSQKKGSVDDSTQTAQLQELQECLLFLAKNGLAQSVVAVLKCGDGTTLDGFVRQNYLKRDEFLLDFTSNIFLGGLLRVASLDTYFEVFKRDLTALNRTLPPRASAFPVSESLTTTRRPNDPLPNAVYDDEDDDDLIEAEKEPEEEEEAEESAYLPLGSILLGGQPPPPEVLDRGKIGAVSNMIKTTFHAPAVTKMLTHALSHDEVEVDMRPSEVQRKEQEEEEPSEEEEVGKTFPSVSLWRDFHPDPSRTLRLAVVRVALPDLGSFESLKALTRMRSVDAFGTPAMRAVVEAQWNAWARRKFLIQFALYIAWLTALTALIEIGVETNRSRSDAEVKKNRVKWQHLGYVLVLALLVLFGVAYFAWREVHQIHAWGPVTYACDPWNVRQTASLLCAALFVFVDALPWSGTNEDIVIGAAAMLLAWSGLLRYARGFELTAAIVRMLITIARDMVPFVIVLIIVIAAFAASLRVLFSRDKVSSCETGSLSDGEECEDNNSGYNDLFSSFVSSLFAGVFGDFDRGIIDDHALYPNLTTAFLVLMLVFTSLVALNALIAFMGDSYCKVSERRLAELAREKAAIIVELFCVMTPEKRQEIEKATRWTFILMPDSDIEEAAEQNLTADEWAGELAEAKRAFRVELAATEKRLATNLAAANRLHAKEEADARRKLEKQQQQQQQRADLSGNNRGPRAQRRHSGYF